MRLDATERHLEARIEALRRELACLVVALSKAGEQLENLAEDLRSRRHSDNVVTLDQRRRSKRRSEPDIVIDFL
jgi:hypothetical protein